MQQIYEMKNLGATGVKYKMKRHGFLWLKQKMVGKQQGSSGACLGYTLTWARKKVEGAADKDTQPSMMVGLLVQQHTEQIEGDWDTSIAAMAKSMGVTATLKTSGGSPERAVRSKARAWERMQYH